MPYAAYWLAASDETPLYTRHWAPEGPSRGALMLSHGMAEHSGRYERLGLALNAAGYHLYAIDQRGHGRTAENGELGHYADHGGWGKVIGDLHTLNQHVREEHPDLPIILLGHSMGSYIGSAYLLQHSASVQAAVLSGSNYQPVALYKLSLIHI